MKSDPWWDPLPHRVGSVCALLQVRPNVWGVWGSSEVSERPVAGKQSTGCGDAWCGAYLVSVLHVDDDVA